MKTNVNVLSGKSFVNKKNIKILQLGERRKILTAWAILSPQSVAEILTWSLTVPDTCESWYFSLLTIVSIPGMCTGKRFEHSMMISCIWWIIVLTSSFSNHSNSMFCFMIGKRMQNIEIKHERNPEKDYEKRIKRHKRKLIPPKNLPMQ